jgi:hypothetical protein
MLTLGFTNQFYTLWNVTKEMVYSGGEVMNGKFNGTCWEQTNNQFIKNLSIDYEKAVEKIKAYANDLDWNENLELRGVNGSFSTRELVGDGDYHPHHEDWEFTFGKFKGRDIREADDVWQLNRAMNEEKGGRRRVYARRRLIELGDLVRYTWVDNRIDESSYGCEELKFISIVRNYATLRQIEKMELAKLSGLFYTNAEKVIINIKEIAAFHFEGQYGTTYVRKYITDDNKVVEYMGGNPLDISKNEFITIKATIKHDNYKGGSTKLLRIKIL